MRPILIGLVAALMAAMIAPAAASAAASAATPQKQTVDSGKRAQGMKDAPGVIAATGVDCQVADARFIGESSDPKTKAKSKYYELACKDAEGFIVAVPEKPGPLPLIYTCMEVNAAHNPNIACILPDNADPTAGLAPLVAKYEPTCELSAARALGQTSDRKTTVFEIACKNGAGYIVDASFPVSAKQPATFNSCLAFSSATQTHCTLSDQASLNTYFNSLVAKLSKPCTPTAHRWVGATASGSNYFEVACQGGKGYMFELKPDGSVGQPINCAVADSIGGGCTLTNARQAQTEQADLYTKLAHQAGFDCTVSKYFPFDTQPAGYSEAVEVACSNRPDGGILLSPTDSSRKEVFYNCAHSELAGFRCTFTKPDAALPSLTADLQAMHKESCTVSGERVMGSQANMGYIEVACADGNPGFIIQYDTTSMKPVAATSCPLAKDIGGGCQMPQNQPHH